MKKHLVLVSLFASLFLVAFTTNDSEKTEQNSLTIVKSTSKFGGAYLTFAGKFGGVVNKNHIKRTTKLGVDGCASGSLITKYTLKIKRQKKKTQVFEGKSHLLTNEIKTALMSLTSGDSFEFSRVTAQLPRGGGKIDVAAKTFLVVP